MIEEEVVRFMNTDPGFKIFQMDDINEWGSFHPFKAMAEMIILTASRTLQGAEVRESLDKTFALSASTLSDMQISDAETDSEGEVENALFATGKAGGSHLRPPAAFVLLPRRPSPCL